MARQGIIAVRAVLLFAAMLLFGLPLRPQGTAEGTKYGLQEEKGRIASVQGAELFQAHCAVCHGRDGKGNGPAAHALKTAVPDLTQISKRNGGTFPTARIQKLISGEEEMVTSSHGSREMPIWGPIFGQIAWDQDFGKLRIYNVTKYVESLQQK